jgi:hypothetical protein
VLSGKAENTNFKQVFKDIQFTVSTVILSIILVSDYVAVIIKVDFVLTVLVYDSSMLKEFIKFKNKLLL